MDTNCAVSPPPGMPLRQTPAEVVEYLQSLGIFWIADREIEWTPAGESRDIERLRAWGESYKGKIEWDGSVVYSHYLMAKCIRSLSVAYETAHFDDGLIVINLRAPRHGNTGPGASTPSDLLGIDRRPLGIAGSQRLSKDEEVVQPELKAVPADQLQAGSAKDLGRHFDLVPIVLVERLCVDQSQSAKEFEHVIDGWRRDGDQQVAARNQEGMALDRRRRLVLGHDMLEHGQHRDHIERFDVRQSMWKEPR